MSDSYLPGAAVLAHSLRDAGTTKKLAVLVTLETLAADTISKLKGLYDYIIPVERIRSPNAANLYLMGRPDLSFTFSKIALWRQTQFRKIVYLDADVVALRALDELFDIEAPFAAAPDIGWPDAFNSGVMVITPNMGEYWALQTMAAAGDSFDGADQGLLNQYFEHRPWQRLKFTYNCTPNAEYQWEPAYRYYKRDISAVHFIGKEKPWSGYRKSGAGVYGELLARWWAVHDRHLREPEPAQNEGQQIIKGEVQGSRSDSSFAQPPSIVIHHEASGAPTENPMTEPGEVAENIDQGLVEPTPTAEQRKFSAPEMEWDATRYEVRSGAVSNMLIMSDLSHRLSQNPRPPISQARHTPSATATHSSRHLEHIQSHPKICGTKCLSRGPNLQNSLSPSSLGSVNQIVRKLHVFSRKIYHLSQHLLLQCLHQLMSSLPCIITTSLKQAHHPQSTALIACPRPSLLMSNGSHSNKVT